ncbi:conserved hypothetical protein [Paenibacillus curdlanolyticus YK9]|uniref:Multi-TM2 domain protein n=1 Tax=Paenibacillus curdlanolyticus YK9 TaxID=717606 RepID=E0IEE1_9BACL|nr:hypothetical protein [Paenibacillus curdlanolyticus]EFM09029.1 conserved hypothetical protein [Paenibacillus curdlanolyticus YK9]
MNPVAILLLGFIPGVGHYLIGRKARAVVYPVLIVGILALLFMAAIMAEAVDPLVVGIVIAFFIWVIQMIDLVVGLLRYSRTQGASSGYSMAQGFQAASHAGFESALGQGEIQPRFAEAGTQDFYNGQGLASQVKAQQTNERFYTILLSFVPGLGHLQLGLLQRGITFMVGFFGLFMMIVFVSMLSNQPGFLVFLGALPIIWVYSMFDAVRMVGRKQAGETLVDRSVLEDFESHRESGKRSRWVAILLSILPGAGHMYLGLQRRGFQLMAGFFIAFYLLDTLRLSLFLVFLPLIWCYSLFDALQHVSRSEERGNAAMEDRPIVEWLVNRQRWVGIGLLLLGGYYVFDQIGLDLIQRYYGDFQLTYEIKRYVQTGAVALAFVIGGVKLLLGGKRGEEAADRG